MSTEPRYFRRPPERSATKVAASKLPSSACLGVRVRVKGERVKVGVGVGVGVRVGVKARAKVGVTRGWDSPRTKRGAGRTSRARRCPPWLG
eukprot:scaffold90171_cov57-Phaeocystis_antarctica.AAC.6